MRFPVVLDERCSHGAWTDEPHCHDSGKHWPPRTTHHEFPFLLRLRLLCSLQVASTLATVIDPSSPVGWTQERGLLFTARTVGVRSALGPVQATACCSPSGRGRQDLFYDCQQRIHFER